MEPIGIMFKHNEKEMPEFSWMLPDTREWAQADSKQRQHLSLPATGWHSPREQQKTFLGDRHWGWMSVVRPGSLHFCFSSPQLAGS